MSRRPLIFSLFLMISACSDDPAGSRERWRGPVYVLSTAVTDTEAANTYIKVLSGIDTEAPEAVDLSDALEVPGWSDMDVFDEHVFVSSAEEAAVIRYAVDDYGALVEDGRISFVNFGAGSGNLYNNEFISETKAYMTIAAEGYVIWDPSTMQITGMVDFPELAPRDGINPAPAFSNGSVLRGKLLFHPVSFYQYDEFTMAPTSVVLVTDTETDTVIGMLEAPCPDLNYGTLDGEGNIYLSNWVYAPSATILEDDAQTCAVRVRSGEETLDASFEMKFSDATDGREAAVLSYLGGTTGMLAVFHDERVTWDPMTMTRSAYAFGPYWGFWTIDLETRAASRIESIDWHAGGYYAYRIDGKTYLLVPGAGYDSTTVYEVEPSGTTRVRLTMNGWSTRLYRVR